MAKALQPIAKEEVKSKIYVSAKVLLPIRISYSVPE